MWIKLCGIRDAAAARLAAELGADAIGLNFFARSPRLVSREAAAEIVAALPPSTEPIGLFVNHSLDDLISTVVACRLSTVQLHGDEPVEYLAELHSRRPDIALIRAFRIGQEGCKAMAECLERCRALDVPLRACLVDAKTEGTYGGSGRVAPWDAIAREQRREAWPPLILAGGLDETNVAAAIRALRPWGVDVSSGIESSPGVKDAPRMRAFVAAVRSAG